MAIEQVRNGINSFYQALASEAFSAGKSTSQYIREMQDKKFAFKITVGMDYADRMKEAVDQLSGQDFPIHQLQDAVRETINNFPTASEYKTDKAVMIEVDNNTLIIWRTSATDALNQTFVNKINDEFRVRCLENWKLNFTGVMADTSQPGLNQAATSIDSARFSQNTRAITGFSHNVDSNVAQASFLQMLDTEMFPNVVLNADGQRILDLVFSTLAINWEQEVDPISGKMTWIIKGEIGGANLPGGRGPVMDLGDDWEDALINTLGDILDNPEAFGLPEWPYDPEFRGSKPFSEVAAEEGVRKIVKPFERLRDPKTGRFVKMTNIPKKNKKVKRGKKVKNPVKTVRKPVKKRYSAAAAATMTKSKGAEKGGGGAKRSGQLARLKKFINSQLSEEVRRNMGRPALINRTGRFANSVQLLNLYDGPNTLMAKYTYLLSPYETFENTGKKRWPLAYNPKNIITKSIRNLAEGKVAQKLRLVRV